jgi:hypothetical protein
MRFRVRRTQIKISCRTVLLTIGTTSYFLLCTAQIFFLQRFKNKITYNFVKFMATKKVWQHIFFHPFFWIRDPGWVKIRIRDKHPGSATLTKMTRIRNTGFFTFAHQPGKELHVIYLPFLGYNIVLGPYLGESTVPVCHCSLSPTGTSFWEKLSLFR